MTDHPWTQFSDPQRRRLCWSLLSPPLLSPDQTDAWPELPHEETLTWLHSVSVGHIEAFMASHPSRRLGLTFEKLWLYFFTEHPDWQVLSHNRGIHQGGRTLGAADFLVRTPHGKVWHMETAVKFYLCLPGRSGAHPEDWVGPSCRDRLDIKIRHLRQRQLRLFDDPVAKQWLSAHDLPEPEAQFACVKGCLYRYRGEPAELPSFINPGHTHHHWDRLTSPSSALEPYHQLERAQWIEGQATSSPPADAADIWSALEQGVSAVQISHPSQPQIMLVRHDWPFWGLDGGVI